MSSLAGSVSAGTHRPVALFLCFSDQRRTTDLLERAIQSQLSDLDVTFYKKELPALQGDLKDHVELASKVVREHQGIAGFWYQMASEDQLFLYVIENRGDRILIRMVEESEEGGRTEAAAVIVRMSIAELLKGGTIGIEVPELNHAEKSLSSEEARSTASSPRGSETRPGLEKKFQKAPHYLFAHTFSYAYYVHSIQSPVNHGLDILLGVRPLPELTVFVEYTFLSPLKVEDEALVLLYDRHPIRVGAKYSSQLISKLDIGASLSLLFDYVTYDVVSTLAVSADKSHLLVGAFPRLELGFRVTSHYSLILSLGAEILINPEYYGHRQQGSRRVLLDGFRVQPWILAGIQFSHFEMKK